MLRRNHKIRKTACPLVLATLLGACSSVGHHGQVFNICGSKFRQANIYAGGPYYVDLTAKNPPTSVVAYAVGVRDDGTVIRVSRDCSVGARVGVAPTGSATLTNVVTAKDGRAEAVRVAVSPNATKAVLTVTTATSSQLVLTLTHVPQGESSTG